MKTKYETLHGQLLNACDQMLSILNKANDSIEAGKVQEEELLSSSIAPDMMNFTKQVTVFSDNAKGAIARLSGNEVPKMDDEETTLSDLIARTEMTKSFIQSVAPESLNSGDSLDITLGWMPEGMYVEGQEYADKFVLQNTFFHLVTAYNILRMKGGEIGKTDFITNLEMKHK